MIRETVRAPRCTVAVTESAATHPVWYIGAPIAVTADIRSVIGTT